MTNSIIERPPSLDKIIHTTFIISSNKTSSWKQDKTGEGSGVPEKRLTHSKTMFVPIHSRLYLGQGYGYRETMYVVGANTHYKEDYYETADGKLVLEPVKKEEAIAKGYQFRPGLKSQGYDIEIPTGKEYRRSMEENICFEHGKLQLSKYGDNPILLRFFNEHEQNKFAPRAEENKDPRRLKLFLFELEIKEAKASKTKIVDSFDDTLEAMKFVDKLRTKTSKGYTYDELKMDAVLNILEEGIGLQQGEVIQKFEIIAKAQRSDGRGFMGSINKVMDSYRMEIGKAESLKVLTYTATEAKLTKEGKAETIFTFGKGTDKGEMVDELVIYFLSDAKGGNDYNEMMRYNEIAKLKALNTKN